MKEGRKEGKKEGRKWAMTEGKQLCQDNFRKLFSRRAFSIK